MNKSMSFTNSRSPALPWEVIEKAIDHCFGDNTTLRSIALTCSQLYLRSRFNLLTHVVLNGDRQVRLFLQAVQARPHLQPIVKSLQLHHTRWIDLSALLSTLPALRQVIFEDTQMDMESVCSTDGRSLSTQVQSLSIRSAQFYSVPDFLWLLSLFPNIEDLSCEMLVMLGPQFHWPIYLSELPKIRLRTLNMYPSPLTEVEDMLLRIAQLDESPSEEDQQTSLTWWISTQKGNDMGIRHAASLLRLLSPSAIKDLTLVFWNDSIEDLWTTCRDSRFLALCKDLDTLLLARYSSHLVQVALRKELKARKTIVWPDTFTQCFASVNEKWRFTSDVRYSAEAGHDSAVTALEVSPDGRWVATASLDYTIILWDSRSACIAQEWIHGDDYACNLVFSSDGHRLVSTGANGKFIVWDVSETARKVTTLNHAGSARGCAMSNDGAYIATVHDRGNICDDFIVWDAQTFELIHCGVCTGDLMFSPDSHWLLLNTFSVWNTKSHKEITLPGYAPLQVEAAAFNPSTTHLTVVYEDGVVHVWDMATRQEPFVWPVDPWQTPFTLSPDGRLLLCSSTLDKMYTVEILDLHTGALVHSLQGDMDHVIFSPCGQYLASSRGDDKVDIWRVSDGLCLGTVFIHTGFHETQDFDNLKFGMDGTMLWYAASNGSVVCRPLQGVIPSLR